MTTLETGTKQKRNRLIALSFASVLMLLTYGPLADWFITVDRVLYDQVASFLLNKSLDDAVILSIDPSSVPAAELLEQYELVIERLRQADVRRIIMPNPPEIGAADPLPAWVTSLGSGIPVYVPTRHRFAEFAAHNGFMDLRPDSDGVLRRSELWQLNNGVMSPSLPLAIAFDSEDGQASHRMSSAEDAIYLSNYRELRRLDVNDLIDGRINSRNLVGFTIFVDSEPVLVGAQALLPSGQYVTHSEIIAALLANVEQDKSVIAPAWAKAIEWLAPVLLAIVAVLFMPDRGRRDIAVLAIAVVAGLLLFEAMVLLVLHTRLDLGRASLIYIGVAILSIWLVGDERKAFKDAFKRGSDFLSASRLEPAFAEFRRCPPSETLATVMYKLSLAFEKQAKPERAEAVLEWMKRTHAGVATGQHKPKRGTGTPRRLGRYVIERRIGRGAMGAVYLGKDPRINRAVAIKAIPIEKEFEDEELKEARLRFYREAESAGRLAHPNIVTVFDAGEDKGLAYIAMEFVPGTPLKDFTDPKRLLAPKRDLELCAETAEALDYEHNQA